MAAAAIDARVIALDIDPGRLKRAQEFGAHELVDVRSDNVVEAIRELTDRAWRALRHGLHRLAKARWAAIRSPRKWGRVVFPGEGGDVTIDVSKVRGALWRGC